MLVYTTFYFLATLLVKTQKYKRHMELETRFKIVLDLLDNNDVEIARSLSIQSAVDIYLLGEIKCQTFSCYITQHLSQKNVHT